MQLEVILHYATPTQPARSRRVTLLSLAEVAQELAIRGWCHESQQERIYAPNRVIDVTDPGSGRAWDIADLAAELWGEQAATDLRGAPRQRRPYRTQELGCVFVDGWLNGAAFGIPSAAMPALDIALTSYTLEKRQYRVWTRGHPQLLAFSAGDLFHAPVETSGQSWAPGKRVQHSTQVKSAASDQWNYDDRKIVPGYVVCDVISWRDETSVHDWRISQQQFLDFLVSGSVAI